MRERKSFVAKNTVRLSFENSPFDTEFSVGNEYISCCAQLSYTCVFHYFNRDCNLSNDVNELSVRNVKNRVMCETFVIVFKQARPAGDHFASLNEQPISLYSYS